MGRAGYRERRQKRQEQERMCQCCRQEQAFSWTCRRCGFAICQDCMLENFWGMSCNGITWVCPDCGNLNGFGNQ